MKNSLKKIIALMLSFIMIMSVAAIGFSVFAEEPADEQVEEVAGEQQEEPTTMHAEGHSQKSFLQMFVDFWKEVFSFLRYIFYGVFRGEKPEPAPSLSF